KKKQQQGLNKQLSLQFRYSLNNINRRIKNWIESDGRNEANSNISDTVSASNDEFLKLPIITNGFGLSFASSGNKEEDKTRQQKEHIKTVEQFLKTDQKLNKITMSQNRSQNNKQPSFRINKEDSKAMVSLKNKMRKEKMRKVRNTPTRQEVLDDNDGSDSELRWKKTIQIKRGSGLLLDASKKSKQ
ncbi:Nop19p ASCRUDRAFT_19848, partial [Ascoidea rubescens DSM 1968]